MLPTRKMPTVRSIPVLGKAELSLQPKLRVGRDNDRFEQEADHVADQIVNQRDLSSFSSEQRYHMDTNLPRNNQSSAVLPGHVGSVLSGTGTPLSHASRRFFESRFGADFSDVRIYNNTEASRSARALNARAYTHGNSIVFGANRYQPHTFEGQYLLAHELTHVVQQTGQGGVGSHPNVSHDRSEMTIRRAIELRPPGRGEASAFGRANELVDRLNTTSSAVTYALAADGRTLTYAMIDGVTPDKFDTMMTGFIDETQVIPLRLITSAGRVTGAGGNFVPLTGDSFVTGYVDLDDLLGSSDVGFKLLLAHFITERLEVPNYARRLGTAGLVPLFNRAHEKGREAEAQVLQDLLNDPSIRFHYDELKPNGTTFVRAFRSRDEGYRVFWVIRGHGVSSTISISDIRVVDGSRRLTIEDFIAERSAPPGRAPP